MSRLTIDLDTQQHQMIKAMALLEGKTIKQFVLDKLFSEGDTEERALEELREVIRQRVQEAKSGDVVHQSISQVAESMIADYKE